MSAYVPTLSHAGWSKTPEEKIDFLLSDFFTSQFSQSYVFNGSISSLQYMIQHYQGNIPSLVEAVRTQLNAYFEAYFDSSFVDVTSNANELVNPTNSVTLTIYAQVEQAGVLYSVGRLIEAIDGRINKITQLNNTGIVN